MKKICPRCLLEFDYRTFIITANLGVCCPGCAKPELSERAAAPIVRDLVWREPVRGGEAT